MRRTLLFVCIISIIFWGCDNSNKECFTSYEIMNKIIEYHDTIKFYHAEIFPNVEDTILYEDFFVVPLTSKIIKLKRQESEIYFTLNGMSSKNTKFSSYFDIADTAIIENQIENNNSQILDTTKLFCDKIPYYREFESYFQVKPILQQYNKDVIFFDKPLFNDDGTLSLLCYIYLKKAYQINKIVLLRKDLKQSSWNIEKQYGFMIKYKPENNDWENDTVFYTIYLGSMIK